MSVLSRLNTAPDRGDFLLIWLWAIAVVVLILAVLAPTPAAAKCHKFSRWYFPYPQRCVSASPRFVSAFVNQTPPKREQIEIPLPLLDFKACPDADDERLQGIAKLRALSEGR
jgi:hypothetical protein